MKKRKNGKKQLKKAHEMREELRIQFELNTSYEELGNQLGEWEEDKQWKERKKKVIDERI